MLDGFDHSLTNEIGRTVGAFKADSWLVPSGSTGPFTADHLAAEDSTKAIARSDPTVKLGAVLALTASLEQNGKAPVDVNVVGSSLPVPLSTGRWPRSDHEAVVNDDLHIGVGRSVLISGTRFTVVGQTAHLRYFAGTNVVFTRLAEAQGMFVFGQHVVSGFVVHGVIHGPLPHGLERMTNAQVITSLRRPVTVAASAIAYLDILLWIVAGGIIGTILYMTALERLRDFAALKAIGAHSSQLLIGIAAQALALSLASAIVAWLVAQGLQPVFPINVEIPASSYGLTLAVAIGVGLLGSIAGVRPAIAIDPALAFGG